VAEVAEDSKAVGSAPVIRFEGLEGNEVAFTPAAQKWTVLHFWATWCKPCIAEFPELKKSLPRLDTDQVQFLVASDEDLDRIDAFQKKYTTGLDLIRMKEGSLADFEIYALPTTLVLDSTGKEVFRHAGQLKWAEISSIDELVAQQP
jgi:thiol-disulfide isomerase/thioredoxin